MSQPGVTPRVITLFRNGETGEVKISVQLDDHLKTRPLIISEFEAATLERLATECIAHDAAIRDILNLPLTKTHRPETE